MNERFETQIIRFFLNAIHTYPHFVFIIMAFAILIFFTKTSRNIDIFLIKTYNNLILIFTSYIFLYGALLYLSTFYKNIEYKIYFIIATVLIIFLYTLIKIFKKSNNKSRMKIQSKQSVLYPSTKKIDKDKYRKEHQIEETEFNIIDDELYDSVLYEHDFVNIYKNNINLITKLEVKDEVKQRYTKLKSEAKRTKVMKLTPLHKEIINAICIAYSKNSEKSEIERVRERFNNLKFPISRLALDYYIYKEYKDSLKIYIMPLVNLMLLAENNLDRELIGALQNTAMSKLQYYGYNYFRIFVDIENNSILKNNKKKITALANKNKVVEITKLHNVIIDEIQKYKNDFELKISLPSKRFDIDFELFKVFKEIANIKIDKLTDEQKRKIEEIYEFYNDEQNKIRDDKKKIEEQLNSFKQNIFRNEVDKYNKYKSDLSNNLDQDLMKEFALFKNRYLDDDNQDKLNNFENSLKEVVDKEFQYKQDINNKNAEEQKNITLKITQKEDKRKMLNKVFYFEYPISKIEVDRIITIEFNKYIAQKKEEDKKNEYQDLMEEKVFFIDSIRYVKNTLDRELIGSFKNIFSLDIQSVGYTYYKVFEERENTFNKKILKKGKGK